jgi:hypothetical protein
MTGYTLFSTYQFSGENAVITGDTGTTSGSTGTTGITQVNAANLEYGYGAAIHCNYIQETLVDSLTGKSINLFFNNPNDFIFLAGSGANNGTGFTATRIYAILQLVQGVSTSGNTISPVSSGWKVVELTDQIIGHTVGQRINAANLASTLFEVTFDELDAAPSYTLDYLNYPPSTASGDTSLAFGDEVLFFGTVRTDIRATVYTTDIPVVLPLGEFNSTTNPTWDGQSSVSISEVGIYDDDGNLVAIGKLNFPITKDSSIARTIAFQIDF